MKKNPIDKYTFIHPDPTLQNNLMAFGFEVGDGWLPLVIELCDKIQAIIDKNPKKYKDFEFTQVKSKYAELTVYVSRYYEEILDLINEYSKKSEKICELCGKPATVVNIHDWYWAVCPEHKEELEHRFD